VVSSRRNIEWLVNEALHRLSAREEQLVKLRFGLRVRPRGLADIVRQLDISPGRVRALEVQALRKLRAAATDGAGHARRRSHRPTNRPVASASAREHSSPRKPRRGEMEERELMRVAAFKLLESAKRIEALAEEAASPRIRRQLSSVSQELRQHANFLAGDGALIPAAGVG